MALYCSLGRAGGRLPLPSLVASHVFPVPTDMCTPSQGSRESCRDENSCKVYHLPLTLALSAAIEIQPSSSFAAQCLTGHTTKSPGPTAECSHIKANNKLWTSGSPTKPLSHGLLVPLSVIPHHLHPSWENELLEEHQAVSGTAAIERQQEDRSTGHPESRRRPGPGGSPPSQRR